MGLRISEINGFEGRVELAGARAVAAMFQRWSLRREGPGDAWTLHAVLSYQKDVLLKHPKFKRRVMVKEHTSGVWYEVKPPEGGSAVIEADQLTITGGELCRTDQTGRP
jgi:hypothetical protein